MPERRSVQKEGCQSTRKNIAGELDLFLACGAILCSACSRSRDTGKQPQSRLLENLLARRGPAVKAFAPDLQIPTGGTEDGAGGPAEEVHVRAALEILSNYWERGSAVILEAGFRRPEKALAILLALLGGGHVFERHFDGLDDLPGFLSLLERNPSRWPRISTSLVKNSRANRSLFKLEPRNRGSSSAYEYQVQLTHFALEVLRIPVLLWKGCQVVPVDYGPSLGSRRAVAQEAQIIELHRSNVRLRQLVATADLTSELALVAATCNLKRESPPVVLFHGPPGTGKSYAALAIAGELHKRLASISIPRIQSKYIGEIEKHLALAFSEARKACAILLIDEADALLMDRHLAMHSWELCSVNTLLSLLERPQCPVILCTNLLTVLDEAVHRRIHHFLAFPVPEVAQRRALWGLALKESRLKASLDLDALAAIRLTGGLIFNAVMQAKKRRLLLGPGFRLTTEALLDLASREVQKMPMDRSRHTAGFGVATRGPALL